MTMNAPLISVALLVRNGMPALERLLVALRLQQGGADLEIVAVDSGSSDGSIEALAQAGAKITRIVPAEFRFGPTRQLAFSLTRGRVIVTMSQDTLPIDATWLQSMTEPILNGEFDIIQSGQRAPDTLSKALYLQQQGGELYGHWRRPYRDLACWGVALSREAWEKTGFGDVEMSEDKYLGMLAWKLGLRMRFAAGQPLLHGHAYTPISLAKRCFNEGMGARTTNGRYSLRRMFRDLARAPLYRTALGAIFKYRDLRPSEALSFPLRPVFIYIGFRFGRHYWR